MWESRTPRSVEGRILRKVSNEFGRHAIGARYCISKSRNGSRTVIVGRLLRQKSHISYVCIYSG